MTSTMVLWSGLGLVTAAIVLSAVALTAGGSARRRVAKGVAVIDRYYGQSRTAAQPAAELTKELPPLLSRMRSIGVRLSPATVVASLTARLDRAGNPAGWTAEKVLAYKGLVLLAGGVLGALPGLGSFAGTLFGAALGGAAGFFLPDLLIYNAATKRQVVLRDQLPDGLDMLTVCVEAGLGFDAALAQVAQGTDGALAAEFGRLLKEMRLGMSRVQALRALAQRTAVIELRAFTSALIQASELGVSTGQVLREQAKEMRVRHRQLAEEKAQKLPVKILFPLMFCIFPALFIIVLGPAAISIMAAFRG